MGGIVIKNDQKVEIAIRSGLAAGSRSEQHHLPGPKVGDDGIKQFTPNKRLADHSRIPFRKTVRDRDRAATVGQRGRRESQTVPGRSFAP